MLIEISDLFFSYGHTPILESISLQVNSGEQWAIIGKNGSGKSTLLRCIAGLEKPYRGSIKIAGRNIMDFKAKERARYISYIPQFCERNLPFIVSDYVMMGRYAYQKPMAAPSRIDRDIVRESLVLTNTEEFADRLMNTLSGGEQQRVFLSAAVAQQAKILLLDEPTTFLDPFHVRNIAQTLRRIIEKYNITIISVSHEMNYSFNLHTNVLALNEKRVYFSGKIDVLMSNGLSTAENLFEVPFEKVHLSSGTTVIFPVIN